MELLAKLNGSQSVGELGDIISSNEQELFDYFSLINQSELLLQREPFKRLSLKSVLVSELDFAKGQNVAFINLVLNASIRMGDRFVFERYYRLLIEKNLEISFLIQASSQFMIGVATIHDLQSRYDGIIQLLYLAYETESDSNKDAISSLINYYALCVQDFGEFASDEVNKVRTLIKNSIDSSSFGFLTDDIVRKVCSVDLDYENNAYDKIHQLLDGFLGRVKEMFRLPSSISYLIETEGWYKDAINLSQSKFDDIYTINKDYYLPIQQDSTFRSLQRGVNVLTDEAQLLCYIFSYGKMHYAKLKACINAIPKEINSHQVIDWGCGQALGSMAYLEQLENLGNLESCSRVVLIEPSLEAIKRGALHVEGKTEQLITINKGFDDLNLKDLNNTGITVHIFSNILDVELFSLTELINLITAVFKGENYFIISSPFINTSKTARIDSFIHFFEKHCSYEGYLTINERKGEWINNWSRVLRVGKAIIK